MRTSLATLPTRLRVLAAATLVVLGTACISSTEPHATSIEQTSFADTLKIDLAKFTKLPSGVYYRDSVVAGAVVGTGAPATAGQTVTISYVGFLPNGSIFDQSTAQNPSIKFLLGGSGVIPGFNEGVIGMKVGGHRRFIIPNELAYGSRELNGVPAYSVLLFDVTLISIQ